MVFINEINTAPIVVGESMCLASSCLFVDTWFTRAKVKRESSDIKFALGQVVAAPLVYQRCK